MQNHAVLPYNIGVMRKMQGTFLRVRNGLKGILQSPSISFAVIVSLAAALGLWLSSCRLNEDMSPQAMEIASLGTGEDTSFTPNSGFIYWTDVAWGFVERSIWKPSCFWRTGSLYGYRYWLTIRTRDYEPNWPPESIVNGERVFMDAYSVLDWYIAVINLTDVGKVSDRDDASVRIDTIIGGNPDHRIMWTGYVFESCYYRNRVYLRVGRVRYRRSDGRRIHFWITPPHTVNVRPI